MFLNSCLMADFQPFILLYISLIFNQTSWLIFTVDSSFLSYLSLISFPVCALFYPLGFKNFLNFIPSLQSFLFLALSVNFLIFFNNPKD